MTDIETPVVIINFKTYPQATGEKAVALAKTCEVVSREFDVPIVVAPQISDIYRVAQAVDIPVFSQHMDPGEQGTLLNHSENRMQLADVELAVTKAKKLGLYTVVCTNNQAVSVAAATMKPNSVAVEPPELIGTGISVSQAQPEVISGTVDLIRNVNKDVVILCGAGISNGDDVSSAMKLGSQGVLLASAVAKSDKPADVLKSLAGPLRK